MLNIRISK